MLVAACSAGSETKDEAATASLTVRTVAPETREWPRELTASGALQPWQEAVISAETGPLRISSLHADVGSRVTRGTVLATLARDSLLADRARLQAQLAEAEANLGKANGDVERARQVGASGALSQQQIQQYRVTQQSALAAVASARAQIRSVEIQLGQTNIVAVDSGIISSRTALLGKVVNAGEELFRIVRQGRIEWQAELDASQLLQVREGQSARVTLPDGAEVRGTVRLVAPTLDGDTSRGIAYIQLPSGPSARAGMYGTGVIETGTAQVQTVPATAVVLRDGRSYVFLLRKDMRVSQSTVTAGQRREARVEVKGLPAGALVVESGGSFLSDGLLVRTAKATDR